MIDTEGMDFEVIKSLDFSRFHPTIIQFEHIHLTDGNLTGCVELLTEHGYRFACVHRDVIAYRPRDI